MSRTPSLPPPRHVWRLLLLGAGVFCLWAGFSGAVTTWQRCYSWDYNEDGRCIVPLPDSTYVVTGSTTSIGPGTPNHNNPYLMKLDKLGNSVWLQTYGTEADEYANCVARTVPDRGFIIAGSRMATPTESDFYVIRTGPTGQMLWSRTYGAEGWLDYGMGIDVLDDGGFVLGGLTYVASFPYLLPSQIHMMRLDKSGSLMWSRKYGRADCQDFLLSIEQTGDGGFLMGGISANELTEVQSFIVLKVAANGDSTWSYEFVPNQFAKCFFASGTADGGCIACGQARPPGIFDAYGYIVKLDRNGNREWDYYTGWASGFYSVQQATDGGYVAAGVVPNDVLLVRLSSAGQLLWTRRFTATNNSTDIGYSVRQALDGGFIITGQESLVGPGTGIYVIKTDANGLVHGNGRSAPAAEDAMAPPTFGPPTRTVAPNPFLSFTSVARMHDAHFEVYDTAGRIVGRYLGDRIGEDLAPGVYLLRPSGRAGPAAVKITKTR
jgi:hypothetical protein